MSWLAVNYQWLIGSVVIPLSGVFAALLVVYFGYRGLQQNRILLKESQEFSKQEAQEERQHQYRPIIAPIGELSHHTEDGYVDWELQRPIVPTPQPGPPGTTVATTEPGSQTIKLQNMGEGVAFNVHSFLYGPLDAISNQYTSWNNGPIQGKSEISILSTHGATVLSKDTKVDGEYLLYDDSEKDYRIARLTTTYHDIFGIIHVSIFDYVRQFPTLHKWMHINTKSGIEHDLEALDNQRQPMQVQRKPIK
jgi:hypothetical protein